MAGRISELTALTGTAAANGDLVEVVDVSDTTMAGSGTNKRMTLGELRNYSGLDHTGYNVIPNTGYVPGQAYSFNGKPNQGGNQLAGYLYFVPVVFAFDAVIATVGVQLGGNATADRSVWLAIYEDNGSARAGARLAVFGQILLPNGTIAGLKSITGLSVPVKGGRLYWYASNSNWNQNGGEYTTPADLKVVANASVAFAGDSLVHIKNTGHIQPPDPAGTLDPNFAGYTAPYMWFQVA